MSPGDTLSDDFVAQVLASEAKSNTKRYLSHGLQAYLPRRSNAHAPKPNTRFLQNILRETGSHNDALREKEVKESRARLVEAELKKPKADERSSRHSHERSSKRRRLSNESEAERDKSKHNRSRKHHKDRHGNNDVEHSREGHSDRHRHRSGHDRHHHRKRDCRAQSSERKDALSRGRSLSPDETASSRHEVNKQKRRPRGDSISDSECSNARSKRQKSPRRAARESSKHTRHRSQTTSRTARNDYDPASDSDPLESLGLIGPRPASPASKVVSRGRGASTRNKSSGIDQHFQSNYNPASDTAAADLDVNDDDWEQALEALRDRQRWHQQGADRLRQAGFSDSDIQKWEGRATTRAGRDDDLGHEDVTWNKRGQDREWDRGKVVVAGGDVETVAEWGRLNDT